VLGDLHAALQRRWPVGALSSWGGHDGLRSAGRAHRTAAVSALTLEVGVVAVEVAPLRRCVEQIAEVSAGLDVQVLPFGT